MLAIVHNQVKKGKYFKSRIVKFIKQISLSMSLWVIQYRNPVIVITNTIDILNIERIDAILLHIIIGVNDESAPPCHIECQLYNDVYSVKDASWLAHL